MAKKKENVASVMAGSVKQSIAAVLGVDLVELSSFNAFAGIPIPSIAFQWLLNSNVYPLGRIMELAGKTMARKSTFMYELMRWHLDAGGYVVLIETEGKDSAGVRLAVWKYNPDYILERSVVKVETVYEEWVQKLNRLLNHFRSTHPNYPVMIGIDSLTAAATVDMQEQVNKEGYTRATYPLLAKALSNDFKTIPEKLRDIPVSVAFTNHYKESISGMPGALGTRPGGSAAQFHETWAILSSPSNMRPVKKVDQNQNWLKFKMLKNSMGPKRDIDLLVEYKDEPNEWYDPDDPNTSKFRLNVSFNWGETDINFLDGLINDATGRYGYGAAKRRAVGSILDLGINKAKGIAWSGRLGITESDGYSISDVGRLIMANPGILQELQDELGIPRSAEYRAGQDYSEVVREETKRLETMAVRKPEQPEEPDTNEDLTEVLNPLV